MSGGKCCYTNNTAVLSKGILIEGYETDGIKAVLHTSFPSLTFADASTIDNNVNFLSVWL